MRIAVLSGKGGTGKTFVSVNLAAVVNSSVYIDCDVEEPNGRLFLKPQNTYKQDIHTMVPEVNREECKGCRKCVDFCKFNALAYIRDHVKVFPELCHACKGCVLLCPQKAISESGRSIGHIEYGESGTIEVRTGVLNTGETTGIPIIRNLLDKNIESDSVLDKLTTQRTIVIDCPPGSSCSAMESIKNADFCILVAEPTLFGIHNLYMVYRLVKLFKKPHALVINKDMEQNMLMENFCDETGIGILARIPYDSELGNINSKGCIAVNESKKYFDLFSSINRQIKGGVQNETIARA